jgi:hypothetical protein
MPPNGSEENRAVSAQTVKLTHYPGFAVVAQTAPLWQ